MLQRTDKLSLEILAGTERMMAPEYMFRVGRSDKISSCEDASHHAA
jgi:hypothetical protein